MATAHEARRAQRREEIIAASAGLFLEQGYAQTSMDAVLRAVGGSKRTLYSHFSSKEDLLLAIVEQMVGRMVGAAHTELASHATASDALIAFGRLYVRQMTQPEIIKLYRLVVGQGLHNPQLKRLFVERGPQRGWRMMAAHMRHFAEQGELFGDDPEMLAVMFLEMLRGPLFMRVYFFSETLSEAELDAHVDRAVRVFLNGARLRS